MKRQVSIGVYLLLFSLTCLGQTNVKKALDELPMPKENTPAQIMILGTFHFNYAENSSDVKKEDNFNINTGKETARTECAYRKA